MSLAGCGLACRFCSEAGIVGPIKEPGRRARGERLSPALWRRLDTRGARSLSFIGGNPDESLLAVLRFLAAAPGDWTVPVVWNCHCFATPEAVRLLHGVVDAFVPDIKFGNRRCGRRLSGATDYTAAAEAALSEMLSQRVPVLARILVLPGHARCCHEPCMDMLARLGNRRLRVSVLGQYFPDFRITRRDGPLARRPAPEEVAAVRAMALERGLSVLD
jgi:putative pyruvate formate lyase activating enzyme